MQVDRLAIVRWDEAPRPETFELIFYTAEGVPQEWLRFETVGIAADQGCDIAGIPISAWVACDLPIEDDGETVI